MISYNYCIVTELTYLPNILDKWVSQNQLQYIVFQNTLIGNKYTYLCDQGDHNKYMT